MSKRGRGGSPKKGTSPTTRAETKEHGPLTVYPLSSEDTKDFDRKKAASQKISFDSGCLSSQSPEHPNEDRSLIVEELADEFAGLSKHQSFFAVYDGHGGAQAAQYAVRHLHQILARDELFEQTNGLQKAFIRSMRELDRRFCEHARKNGINSGACCIAAVLRGRRLVVANCGDCRAVYYDSEGEAAHELSRDHTGETPSEKTRIESLGGWLQNGRVFGVLEPSRGIGDVDVKDGYRDKLRTAKKEADTAASPSRLATEESKTAPSASLSAASSAATSPAAVAAAAPVDDVSALLSQQLRLDESGPASPASFLASVSVSRTASGSAGASPAAGGGGSGASTVAGSPVSSASASASARLSSSPAAAGSDSKSGALSSAALSAVSPAASVRSIAGSPAASSTAAGSETKRSGSKTRSSSEKKVSEEAKTDSASSTADAEDGDAAEAAGDEDGIEDHADFHPDSEVLSCQAEVSERLVSPGSFLIIASDGVWDVMSTRDVVVLVRDALLHAKGVARAAAGKAQLAAKLLVEAARRRKGNVDDVTAIVVHFQK